MATLSFIYYITFVIYLVVEWFCGTMCGVSAKY